MGVKSDHYVFYGMKLPYLKTGDDDKDEQLHDKWYISRYTDQKPGEFVAVWDFMSGKYTIVGVLLARSSEYGFGEIFTISDDLLKVPDDKVKEFFEDYNIKETFKPEVIVFTHYT